MNNSIYDFVNSGYEWGDGEQLVKPDHPNLKIFEILNEAQKVVYEMLVYHKWVFTYKNIKHNLQKWKYFKFDLNDFYIALLKYEIELGQVLDIPVDIKRLTKNIQSKIQSLEKDKKWLSKHSGLKCSYSVYLVAKKLFYKKYDFSYSFLDDRTLKQDYALRIEKAEERKKWFKSKSST